MHNIITPVIFFFQDHPKITKRKYKGRIDLKCTARGNYPPPQITWKLNDGPEILGTFCPPRHESLQTQMDDACSEILQWALTTAIVPSTAQSQITREDRTYGSSAILSIQAVEDKVTVTCFLHHPALYSRPLNDFAVISQKSEYVSPSSHENKQQQKNFQLGNVLS